MLTAWIPLGNVPSAQGAVLVCRGSHRSRSFAKIRQTYGETVLGADGTPLMCMVCE